MKLRISRTLWMDLRLKGGKSPADILIRYRQKLKNGRWSEKERDRLELSELLKHDRETLERFRELSRYGEYNVKFLLLLAKLLMLQEKTNYPEGQLFQKLLIKLKEGEDIFSILQTATLRKLG